MERISGMLPQSCEKIEVLGQHFNRFAIFAKMLMLYG